MIRHYLHFQDCPSKVTCDLGEKLFQAHVNAIYENLPPIFGAEDDMVLATVNDMFAMMVWPLHLSSSIHSSYHTTYLPVGQEKQTTVCIKSFGGALSSTRASSRSFPAPAL